MTIAYDAHHGQTDKDGVPYIYHPMHLAEQMDSEDEIIVALLHDVVEDTQFALEDLRREGFPDAAIEAINLLTHKDGVEYTEYVKAIGDNPLAKKVKLADLDHNSDEARLEALDKATAKRLREKYRKAKMILTTPAPIQQF